jgi:hypothetical protein
MSFLNIGRKKNLYFTKAMIGAAVGLVRGANLLLKDGVQPQQAMDVLASWIGKEIGKTILADKKDVKKYTEEDLVELLLQNLNVAEQIHIKREGDAMHFSIRKCNICPKRVGGYDLGGKTSCPVGGLLLGFFSVTQPEMPVWSIKLKPSEYCEITIPKTPTT